PTDILGRIRKPKKSPIQNTEAGSVLNTVLLINKGVAGLMCKVLQPDLWMTAFQFSDLSDNIIALLDEKPMFVCFLLAPFSKTLCGSRLNKFSEGSFDCI